MLGLTAPFYQDFDLTEDLMEDDSKCINLALRTVRTEQQKFINKQIKADSFIIRYKNFMQSPRSHFIYEMVIFGKFY